MSRMKVIISHDIDHMTVWEHTKDLILPKFLVRNHIEFAKGKISLKEYFLRWADLGKNKWQRIQEIIEFNKSQGITSHFFIGVNNGVGLNYSIKHVRKWVPIITNQGFEVGVHGINYDSLEKVKAEHSAFREISKTLNFGIRMHYLRQNDHTFSYLEKAGYTFDASESGFKNPYKIGEMWEFPLQIMEGWIFYQGKRHQSVNLAQAKEITLREIEKAKSSNLDFLNILFHDRYYHKSFKTWKQWYDWLIIHLKKEGFEFVTYGQAMEELNKKASK